MSNALAAASYAAQLAQLLIALVLPLLELHKLE